MKVAIIGRTQILYETALRLCEEGHEIGCVVTAKAAPEYSRRENDFERLAGRVGAPFFLTSTLGKPVIEAACKGLDVGVSMNWISVIGQHEIDLFRLGILNSHHGDLPRYRGNACSNWAIIRGESRITNSIHFMEGDKLDCGKIVEQAHFELGPESSITDVYQWAEESTPGLFASALIKLAEAGDYSLKYADPESPASFRCYPRLPEDGFIDWSSPAVDVSNLIRAVSRPFAGAYTYHWHRGEVKKLLVLKGRLHAATSGDLAVPGHVLHNDSETGESLVQCGDGVVALLECRYEGEEESFAPGTRWRSIRMRLGVRVEDWLWAMGKGDPGA